jgi:hypothetical protein
MIYNWILIIAIYSPNGVFIGKNTIELESQQICEEVKSQLLAILEHPLRIGHRGICVTRDHWEGKEQMPGVAYD